MQLLPDLLSLRAKQRNLVPTQANADEDCFGALRLAMTQEREDKR
jgi:hypothetical protein